MDNNNDSFNSLGLDGVTLHNAVEEVPVSDSKTTDDNLDDVSKMSDEEFLETFAAGLLAEKDLGEMDDETRADMIHDLVERITTFVNRAILEALPSDKLDEVDKMSDNDASLEEINKIIKESGINVEQITADALEKFRGIYLGPNENAEV